MQLDIFIKLYDKYQSLEDISFDESSSIDDVVKKLQEISVEKRKIKASIDDFLQSFIVPLENESHNITDTEYENLKSFLATFANKTNMKDVDLYFRVHKLLLKYAIVNLDYNKQLEELYYTGYGELLLQSSFIIRDYTFFKKAREYEKYYDTLSTEGKMYFLRCYGNSTLDKKLEYENIISAINFIKSLKEKEPGLLPYDKFILSLELNLSSTVYFCTTLDLYKKYPNITFASLLETKRREVSEECRAYASKALKHVFDCNYKGKPFSFLYALAYERVLQAKFQNHEITIEEFLDELEKISRKRCSNDTEKLRILCITYSYYSIYAKLYLNEKIDFSKKLNRVNRILNKVSKSGTTDDVRLQTLNFFIGISYATDFEKLKKTIFNSLVIVHKSTYIHTLMVEKIANILVTSMLKKKPAFFEGILEGYKVEDILLNKKTIVNTMSDMALMHDIGKFYVIDYVGLSYRSLSKEEFKIIQEHSDAGDGTINIIAPQPIREAMEHHHLWFNREGGYPLDNDVLSLNKPLVDILSVADTIDAATDNIGRPYNLAKSYEEIVSELDEYYDTRYSGEVINLLHDKRVTSRIKVVLDKTRKELNYKAYVDLK